MKSILIGSVGSSKVVLERMIKLNFPIDLVFSLDEKYSENVSGYYPIHKIAKENDIQYRKFKKINKEKNIKLIKEIKPDYVFVIGLSQLVSKRIINFAKKGVIGFHPTPLPKYRGRAAIPWQILLEEKRSKSTMFFIDDGIDSGDIIDQENYHIAQTDYASDIHKNVLDSLEILSTRVLKNLIDNKIVSKKQDNSKATYLLKRVPEDGEISWENNAKDIQKLIRAVSKPYPGAFSYYENDNKIIFWKADYLENNKYIGIPGQIAKVTDEYIEIICGEGLLRVKEFKNINEVKLKKGYKFK